MPRTNLPYRALVFLWAMLWVALLPLAAQEPAAPRLRGIALEFDADSNAQEVRLRGVALEFDADSNAQEVRLRGIAAEFDIDPDSHEGTETRLKGIALEFDEPGPNTPAGSNVSVDLGSGVSVTFAGVTITGQTHLLVTTAGPAAPDGFRVVGSAGQARYFDIATTAEFTPPITVIVPYDPIAFQGPESGLRLLHFLNDGTADSLLPTSRITQPDPPGNVTLEILAATDRIRGEVQHLSPFVVVEAFSTPPAPPTVVAPPTRTRASPLSLSGAKEAGTSILINGVIVVPIDAQTTWSYDLALIEGHNTISITSGNAAGQQSPSTVTFSVTLDTTAPAAPTLDSFDSPTPLFAIVLSGTKEAGGAVVINGVVVVPADALATWSARLSLALGDNSFDIFVRDEAGNDGLVVTRVVQRAEFGGPGGRTIGMLSALRHGASIGALPSIPAHSLLQDEFGPGGIVPIKPLAFVEMDTVTAVSLADVDVFFIVFDSQFGPVPTLTSEEAATLRSFVEHGGHLAIFSGHAAATAANSLTQAFGVTIFNSCAPSGTARPTASIPDLIRDGPFGAVTHVSWTRNCHETITVLGLAIPIITGPNIEVALMDRDVWSPGAGAIIFAQDFMFSYSHLHTITGAPDPAFRALFGNLMHYLISLSPGHDLPDTTPAAAPKLNPITSPTRFATQTIGGTKAAGDAVLLNDVEIVPADAAITWSFDMALAEGNNPIALRSRNAAGNLSRPAVNENIALDLTPPATPTVTPPVSPTRSATQTISGAKEAGTAILIDGQLVVAPSPATTWSHTILLELGANHHTITARDAVGNQSLTAANITIVLDPALVPVPNPTVIAVADAVTIPENEVVPLPTLTDNDTVSGVAPGQISIIAVTQLQDGSGIVGAVAIIDGVVWIAPDQDFHGVAKFRYSIALGGATAEAEVSVTVTATNDAPRPGASDVLVIGIHMGLLGLHHPELFSRNTLLIPSMLFLRTRFGPGKTVQTPRLAFKTVVRIDADSLAGIDLFYAALHSGSTATNTAAEARALREFAARGGAVMVFTGGSWPLATTMLGAPFGITATFTRTTASIVTPTPLMPEAIRNGPFGAVTAVPAGRGEARNTTQNPLALTILSGSQDEAILIPPGALNAGSGPVVFVNSFLYIYWRFEAPTPELSQGAQTFFGNLMAYMMANANAPDYPVFNVLEGRATHLDLFNLIADAETAVSGLSISLADAGPAALGASLAGGRFLNIQPIGAFRGSVPITLSVSDGVNTSTSTMQVFVQAANLRISASTTKPALAADGATRADICATVTNKDGAPVANKMVLLKILPPNRQSRLAATSGVTDANGRFCTVFTAGTEPGIVTVEVSVVDDTVVGTPTLIDTQDFTLQAIPGDLCTFSEVFTVSTGNPRIGEVVDICVDVTNVGDTATPAGIKVAFYDRETILLAEPTLPAIASGATVKLCIQHSFQ
ncbi:MAG: hypothetical protein HY718_12435, partial [Planctomycetes bacterium]|nr:hypothetical protein [Planctomycetota bacterium]